MFYIFNNVSCLLSISDKNKHGVLTFGPSLNVRFGRGIQLFTGNEMVSISFIQLVKFGTKNQKQPLRKGKIVILRAR